jgi:hypothetical protein
MPKLKAELKPGTRDRLARVRHGTDLAAGGAGRSRAGKTIYYWTIK